LATTPENELGPSATITFDEGKKEFNVEDMRILRAKLEEAQSQNVAIEEEMERIKSKVGRANRGIFDTFFFSAFERFHFSE